MSSRKTPLTLQVRPFDEGLLWRVKQHAAERRQTLAEYVTEALRVAVKGGGSDVRASEAHARSAKGGVVVAQAEPLPEMERLYETGQVRQAGVKAQAEPKSAAPDVVEVGSDPKCRKCGHLQTQHWDRGCYGACVCAAGRFAAEDV